MLYRIPSAVRGDGVVSVRNECHLLGNHFHYQVPEGRFRISLYVEFGTYQFFKKPYVFVFDVPSVRSRMHGYTLGTETFYVSGRFLHIRHIAPASISQSGDLIYIYTKYSHRNAKIENIMLNLRL